MSRCGFVRACRLWIRAKRVVVTRPSHTGSPAVPILPSGATGTDLAAPGHHGPLAEAEEQTLFAGHPALLPSIGALFLTLVTLGLALVYFAVRQRSKYYRITSQRVVIETGIFSKRMDQIDIYRINDYVVELPFSQRIMGNGNLVLSSMDRSTPSVTLHALRTDVRRLYEQLRVATEREKRRHGVRMIDYE